MSVMRFSCWIVVATIGLAILVGPLFTHGDLSASHILAHLGTGPAILALAIWQMLSARRRTPARWPDVLLVLLGAWVAILPFVIPAPGMHVFGHIAVGALVALGAAWSAWSPRAGKGAR